MQEHRPQNEAAIRPYFVIPLWVVLVIPLFLSMFAATFHMAQWQLAERDDLLTGVTVGFTLAALLCWLWFVHAVRTRRRFGRCRLRLQNDCHAEAPCRFEIDDPDSALTPMGQQPAGTLAYEELSRRKNGRKRYREGPFEIDVPVTLKANSSTNTVEGTFTIPEGVIKTGANPDWITNVNVILTVQIADRQKCKFLLSWQ